MVRTVMLRTFRGVCLICFCILGAAVIVALLEVAAYPIILNATGCSSTEVLFSFTCGDGWVGHSIAMVLNLPLLFDYARTVTLFGASAPIGREFMLLLYLFDGILRSDVSPPVAL